MLSTAGQVVDDIHVPGMLFTDDDEGVDDIPGMLSTADEGVDDIPGMLSTVDEVVELHF